MKETAEKLPSIWTPAFIALVVVQFLSTIGQFASSTVCPLLARDLGATASIIGFVAGAFAVSALATRPFFGPAIDSFSKKKLLFAVYVVLGVAYFSYAFAKSVPAVIAIRLVNGIGIGCTGPLTMAFASETLPKERLSSGLGFFAAASAGAQVVGPAFGIESSQALGYRFTFITLGVFILISMVLLVLFVKETPNPDRPPYQIRLNRIFATEAVAPAFMLFFLSLAYGCTNAFIPVYGGLRGVDRISLYFVIYAILTLGTRPLFGSLAERYGTTKVFLAALCFFGASYALIAFSTSLPMFILAALVAGCGFGASTPLVHSLTFKCVPRSRRGTASNTNYTGMDTGAIIGPYAGGMLIEMLMANGVPEVSAYSHMWLVMIIPIALSATVYLTQRKRLARYQAEVEAQQAAE